MWKTRQVISLGSFKQTSTHWRWWNYKPSKKQMHYIGHIDSSHHIFGLQIISNILKDSTIYLSKSSQQFIIPLLSTNQRNPKISQKNNFPPTSRTDPWIFVRWAFFNPDVPFSSKVNDLTSCGPITMTMIPTFRCRCLTTVKPIVFL